MQGATGKVRYTVHPVTQSVALPRVPGTLPIIRCTHSAHCTLPPARFTLRVLAVVRAIPAGKVATYGDVAELAGAPGAARAVGNIMRECHDPAVPCHRVVAAGGRLGGYGGREHVKRELLQLEGVAVAGRRVRGFAEAHWRPRRAPLGRSRRTG